MRIDAISAAKTKQASTLLDAGDFFAGYAWCLNPFVRFSELWVRLDEEFGRLRATALAWQKEEVRTNLYLLACAISCTAEDFLSSRRWHLRPLERYLPRLRPVIRVVEDVLNAPSTLAASVRSKALWGWKADFDRFLESICRLLISGEGGPDALDIEMEFRRLRNVAFPEALLGSLMRLNEGFRCQDLSHQDVLALAERFAETAYDRDAECVVIGARTAGSYFAPLVKVRLESLGFRRVFWATVRPRYGTRGIERRKLKTLLRSHPRVILTDDYSNTGRTLQMLEEEAVSLGISPRDITVLAPFHPSGKGRLPLPPETLVIPVNQDELHLSRLLQPEPAARLLSEILAGEGASAISIAETAWSSATNRALHRNYPASFQVRLKRVYDVEIAAGEVREHRRIVAKGVGLGWLGYHAYLSGKVLKDYVPRVLGLRQGVLFMEWVEGRPLAIDDLSNEVLERIAEYVAARALALELEDDPRARPPFLGWGWLELLALFRRVYNVLFGYLKHALILEQLQRRLVYRPSLIDGRMRPDEWRVNNGALIKLDFEQHCFGAPELDVVDPAYDLAVTSFEFFLSSAEEEKLIARYARQTKDVRSLRERVFLYKLLYATAESERLHHRLHSRSGADEQEKIHERLLWSWNFRVSTMNRFTSGLMRRFARGAKPRGLFFMDLDGVFDCEVLGFPHTTVSGLEAIALLQSEGYAVIPNTGRSCEQVSDYCTNFGFSDGIAEYGSAIVDVNGDSEVSLVDDPTLRELEKCRALLGSLGGVFLDSGYRYSVRAFRYNGKGTAGLSAAEAEGLLVRHGLRRLRVIAREADTYFVGKQADKGKAAEMYRARAYYSGNAVGAIGDSDEDVPMLNVVPFAYAPARCSRGIHRLAKQGRCRIASLPQQPGLLQSVEIFLHVPPSMNKRGLLRAFDEETLQHLICEFLTVAEAPLRQRILLCLQRRRLV